MYVNVAAGRPIVLGAVIAILGFILARSIPLIVVGLASVAVGGLISALGRQTA